MSLPTVFVGLLLACDIGKYYILFVILLKVIYTG